MLIALIISVGVAGAIAETICTEAIQDIVKIEGMATMLRIATFNLENFDDLGPTGQPTLAERIALMRPQLERLRADVLCLQEVNTQEVNGLRTFAALEQLIAGTAYATFQRV